MMRVWHGMKVVAGMLGSGSAPAGPLWIQIGLANPCNHRCIMCWDHPPRRTTDPAPDGSTGAATSDSAYMPMPMLERLADDLRAMGTPRVELAGRGEPLLHPAFLDAVALLKRRRFNVSLVTNASRMEPEHGEQMVRLGVDRLTVSLNAGTADTYARIHTNAGASTFERIALSLADLRRRKQAGGCALPQVVLSFVLCRENGHEGFEMLAKAQAAGADHVLFRYAIVRPGDEAIEMTPEQKRAFAEQLPALQQRARDCGIGVKLELPADSDRPDMPHQKMRDVYSRIGCYIGWLFALVTAEGLVWPCCHCVQPIGDMRQEGFREIWNGAAYRAFRARTKRLPSGGAPAGCACDDCTFDKVNLSVHNLLHPHRRQCLDTARRSFSLRQLLRAAWTGEASRATRQTVRDDEVHADRP